MYAVWIRLAGRYGIYIHTKLNNHRFSYLAFTDDRSITEQEFGTLYRDKVQEMQKCFNEFKVLHNIK